MSINFQKIIKLSAVLFVAAFIFFGKVNFASALVCTSQAGGGGNWNNAASWATCNRIPTTADSVVISTAQAITIDSAPNSVTSVTINSGATLDGGSATLNINNTAAAGTSFTNNGGTWTSSTGTVNFGSDASVTILGGTGTFTGSNKFNNITMTVTPSAGTLTYTMGKAVDVGGNWTTFPTGTVASRELALNLGGATTVTGTLTLDGTGCSSADTTASLTTLSTTGSNHALTVGAINIKTFASGELCVLTGNASVITLTGTSGTLFSKGGTFTSGTSEVKVTSASGSPTLLSAATTFYKLTINSAATVINMGAFAPTFASTASAKFYIQSGVFNAYGANIVPGSTATFQIDSGGTFCLGGTAGSTTADCLSGAADSTTRAMPAFVVFSFNSASTVKFLSSAATNISNSPTYGNLVLAAKLVSTSRIYTALGALTVAGNLTINPDETGAGTPLLTLQTAGNVTVTGATTITTTNSATSKLCLRGTTCNAGSHYNLTTATLAVSNSSSSLDCTSCTSTITVSGTGTPFTLSSDTFTEGTSTFKYTGNGATLTATTYSTLELKPSSSTAQIFSSGTYATANLTIGDGTNAGAQGTTNNPTITVSGNMFIDAGATFSPHASGVINSGGAAGTIYGSGTIEVSRTSATADYVSQYKFSTNTLNSMTVNYVGASAQTVTPYSAVGDYGNLGLGTQADSNTVSYTLGGDIGVTNIVTVGASSGSGVHTLNGGSAILYLNGGGTPFIINSQGAFNGATGTVLYNGTTPKVTATTYNNLGFYGSSTATLGTASSQTITVNGNWGIGGSATVSTTTYSPTVNVLDYFYMFSGAVLSGSGTGTFTVTTAYLQDNLAGSINLTGGTFVIQDFGEITGASTYTFNNLTLGDGDVDELTATSGAGTLNIGGVLTINANHQFNLVGSTKTVNFTGTGTPFVSTGTFSGGSSTVNYTGNGATIGCGSATYNNLNLKPSSSSQQVVCSSGSQTLSVGGTLTIGDGSHAGATLATNSPTVNVTGATTIAAGAILTTGDGASALAGGLTVTGTLSGSGTGTITITGDFIGTGTTNLTGNTVIQKNNSATDQTFGSASGSNNWIFNNLKFDNATTGDQAINGDSGGSGTFTVAGTLTIGTASNAHFTLFNPGSRTWILSGSGTPLVSSSTTKGLFNGLNSSNSTVRYTSTSATNVTTALPDSSRGANYYNLELKPAGTVTYTLAAASSETLFVTNFTIGNGSDAVTLTAATNNPDMAILGDMTIAASAIFTKGAAGPTFAKGGSQTLTDSTVSKQDLGVVNINSNTTNTTVVLGSSVKFTSVVINSSQALTLGSNTLTLTGSSTPLTNSGTLTTTGSTIEYSNSGATITNMTYVGLKVSAAITASTTATVTGALTTTAAFAPTAGTITLNNGASIVTSGSAPTFSSLTIASGATVTTSSNFSVGGTLTVSSTGVFSPSAGTITMNNGSTITNSGTTLSFYDLTVAASATASTSSSFTVKDVLSVGSSGVFNPSSGTITLSGSGTPIVATGTFAPTGGTVQYTHGTSANVAAVSYYNLTVGGTGTYTMPATTLTVRGNLVVTNNATVVKGAGTVLFAAGTTQTVTDNNSTKQDLGNIQISANSTDTTLNLGSSIKVTSVIIDASQTLGANGSNTLTLTAGPWTNNGTFTRSTSTVTIAPTSVSSPVTIAGSSVTTFNNFTASTAGTILNFKASQDTGFAGTFTVAGAGSNPIFIASDTPSTKWNINLSGTAIVSLAYLKDSGCAGGTGTVFLTDSSVDQGNNTSTCWRFILNSSPTMSDTGASGGGAAQFGGVQGNAGNGGSDSGDSGGGSGQGGGGQGGGGGGATP